MATIAYALLILRTIRSAGQDGTGAFVPGLAVTVALLLAFVSLIMLVYFIHHIGVRIQVSSIIESVTHETLETVEHMSDELQRFAPAQAEGGATRGGRPIAARRSGYLQYLSIRGLVDTARERDLVISVLVPPGGWVQEGAPLFRVQAADEATYEDLDEWLADKVGIGSERSMRQDVGFGVQQLVDVAVKALSPGINDPTTATQCIDRLTQVLVAAGRRTTPPRLLADREGALRVVLRYPSFADLLQQAFEQVRHFGASMPVVMRHLALALTTLRQAVPQEHAEPIRREGERLLRGADGMEEEDRDELRALLMDALA